MVPKTGWRTRAKLPGGAQRQLTRGKTHDSTARLQIERTAINPDKAFPSRSNENIVCDSEMGDPRAHTTSATTATHGTRSQRTSHANRVGSK